MTTSTLGPSALFSSPSQRNAPALLRSLLLTACAVAVATAAALGHPAAFIAADPELAFLLRGMAAIKAAIVLAAVAVLVWRFARPVPQRTALAYIAGVAVLAAATTLIWQLSFIPFAAIVFHLAEFVVLVAAWRDVDVARLAR